jgi:hypothetical protein
MRSRNALTGALLAAGSIIGALLYRRRLARRRDRVDLYYADGAMISLTSAADAEPFLRHAREILSLAGG